MTWWRTYTSSRAHRLPKHISIFTTRLGTPLKPINSQHRPSRSFLIPLWFLIESYVDMSLSRKLTVKSKILPIPVSYAKQVWSLPRLAFFSSATNDLSRLCRLLQWGASKSLSTIFASISCTLMDFYNNFKIWCNTTFLNEFSSKTASCLELTGSVDGVSRGSFYVLFSRSFAVYWYQPSYWQFLNAACTNSGLVWSGKPNKERGSSYNISEVERRKDLLWLGIPHDAGVSWAAYSFAEPALMRNTY